MPAGGVTGVPLPDAARAVITCLRKSTGLANEMPLVR